MDNVVIGRSILSYDLTKTCYTFLRAFSLANDFMEPVDAFVLVFQVKLRLIVLDNYKYIGNEFYVILFVC